MAALASALSVTNSLSLPSISTYQTINIRYYESKVKGFTGSVEVIITSLMRRMNREPVVPKKSKVEILL